MFLIRIEPSWVRGERIALDPHEPEIHLGRSESSNIRLFTASSSRDQATIVADASGEWMVRAEDGTNFLIDGYPIREPVALEEDMNIVAGEDHLRCIWADTLAAEDASTEIDGLSAAPSRAQFWIRGAAIALVVAIGMSLLLWLGSE